MKKILAFALPVCLLMGCSSGPKTGDGTGESSSEDTIAGNIHSPEAGPETETKKLPVPKNAGDQSDYDYLVKYIGKPGKKNVKKNVGGSPCTWSQTFGEAGDITYDMINCVESNGYNYRITFAGYEKEEVVKFVEWFYSDNDEGWDKEKTVYGPKGKDELGCFYYVKQDKAGNYYMECTCVC